MKNFAVRKPKALLGLQRGYNSALSGLVDLLENARRTSSRLSYKAYPPESISETLSRKFDVAHYALEGLPNKVMAAEYKMKLPDEKILVAELRRSRKFLENKLPAGGTKEVQK